MSGLRPVLVRMLEGRVGSTLVMQLLATAPEIALERGYPYEHSYLTYLVRLAAQLSAPAAPDGELTELLYAENPEVGPLPFASTIVDRDALGRDGLAALWDVTGRALNPDGSARLYAEKYWGRLEPVLEAGLSPLVIDLVRDPRDVLASMRAFNRTELGAGRFGRDRATDDSQHLRRVSIGMALRFSELEAPVPVPRITLRYEDLILDLPGAAAKIEALTGARLDPDAVIAARPQMAEHMTASTPEASIGRYRQDLSGPEIAAIERRLGRHMAEVGYTLHGDAPTPA